MIWVNLQRNLIARIDGINKIKTTFIDDFIGLIRPINSKRVCRRACLIGVMSLGSLNGCYQPTSSQEEGFEPLPSNTPFIMGHLEAATDTFFMKGIPNSIMMSEKALKEWEREYELQFSIQFKF